MIRYAMLPIMKRLVLVTLLGLSGISTVFAGDPKPKSTPEPFLGVEMTAVPVKGYYLLWAVGKGDKRIAVGIPKQIIDELIEQSKHTEISF